MGQHRWIVIAAVLAACSGGRLGGDEVDAGEDGGAPQDGMGSPDEPNVIASGDGDGGDGDDGDQVDDQVGDGDGDGRPSDECILFQICDGGTPSGDGDGDGDSTAAPCEGCPTGYPEGAVCEVGQPCQSCPQGCNPNPLTPGQLDVFRCADGQNVTCLVCVCGARQ